jgi:hypothetical protein
MNYWAGWLFSDHKTFKLNAETEQKGDVEWLDKDKKKGSDRKGTDNMAKLNMWTGFSLNGKAKPCYYTQNLTASFLHGTPT